ncbi:Structural maintenance of chromosomes protein 2 [Orbilia brochopaga]|uniref:Structural maintenance of chromosomes protein n=1 Tax=Orbilia brochopaga TaxID=3140254 RepID=A0AAV9V029_9PEZI
MRVIEIVIDGFKSYAVRTVISGWDESFNSITGLNGSGKSNILDSICFVLGITNMSTVRAQNLQDLIYKRGQAGVTKASVTIVFDNSDKKRSPIGFEEYTQISVTRQIVLGGTSKYLINGHRAQQQTVQNLFQSVQLNINNPNFLIMQGRITKVLNMKPEEVLALIEEAAGTRMFEDRRDKALKTMAKKDNKVQEINTLLQEEIEPKLEKLRAEKRAFLDFQQTQSDLERLSRVVIAHDYVKSKDRISRASAELQSKGERISFIENGAKRMKMEIQNLEEDAQRVQAQRDAELRKGGRFQDLEDNVKESSHEMVRLQTLFDLKRAQHSEEQSKFQAAQAALQNAQQILQKKTEIFDNLKGGHEAAKQQIDHLTAEMVKQDDLLQSLQTGVASKEGHESGYQSQLQDAKHRLNTAITGQEQAKIRIADLEKRIREEEPRAKRAGEQNASLYQALETLKDETNRIRKNLQSLGYEEGAEERMRGLQLSTQRSVRELQEQVDKLRRKVASIEFTYSDPVANFDRSKVKGLVAQLFSLSQDKYEAGTALEICAGGRLYNVVVDSEVTGAQLLEKGRLRKRVTIIPLNKINAMRAAHEKVESAHKLAPGKVHLALSLIGYSEEVSRAMEYVFGSTLVCANAETAQRVTFDPSVRLMSVTLDGDVYDPAGTLSGGSAPTSSGVLITLQELNVATGQLESETRRLREIESKLEGEKRRLDEAKGLKQKLDLKIHEIKITEEQISNNASSNIIKTVEERKQAIAALQLDIQEFKQNQVDAANDIKRIEQDMHDFTRNKDGKLAELQKSVALAKSEVARKVEQMKVLQKEYQNARLEMEQAGGDLSIAKEQLEESSSSLTTQQSELNTLVEKQTELKNTHQSLLQKLEEERAKLSGFDDELQSLLEAIKVKNSRITEEALELQQLKHEAEKVKKEQESFENSLKVLESEYEWIQDEEENFGRAGSPYDYSNQNIAECRSSLKNLNERFQGMKKKINPKVMNMIDSVEKKEVALKKMLHTVIRDKEKITKTIESLDEYKRDALKRTWEKVTVDFGQIFSELLPGSFAKLEPPEGKDITEGLEVKVSLGKIWKQSLTELSGGQRSLIALSLILALLQFKPAPMYILDEVDAALDLSHTQNIGRLIKTRFKGAQFIVVSLKDGMFQNANCIFRTRFQDGTSVVMQEKGGETQRKR